MKHREKLDVTLNTNLAEVDRRPLQSWLRVIKNDPRRNQNRGSDEWNARELLIREVSTYLAATTNGTRLKVVESTPANGIKLSGRSR